MTRKIVFILFVFVLIAASVIAAAAMSMKRDSVAAGDLCSVHNVFHEDGMCPDRIDGNAADVSHLNVKKEGTCPRCHIGEIVDVCSKEPIYTDDGDIWFYRSCDDPSHPDGCQIKESFCYTNHACVGCEAHYFNSDVLTHVESSEHTLGGDAVTECEYPVVYPPEHHH